MSSKDRSMPKKGKSSSLENIVESQKKKKSTASSSSGTSIASGTTSSSSGSKSPSRKSKSTKMVVNASTMAKTPTIPEESSTGRTRPRMARRMSDDTFAFDQNDWNDSETEGFSPVSDGTAHAGHGFLLKNQKNAIQPLTRKVTETEQEWFSEWEDMDGDGPNAKSKPSAKNKLPKEGQPVSSAATSTSSKKWTLSYNSSETNSEDRCESDPTLTSDPPKQNDRKSPTKERSNELPADRASRSKRSKEDGQRVAADRRRTSSGDKTHGEAEEKSRGASQTNGTSRKPSKSSSRDEDDDDMDVSRSGRRKQSTTSSDHDDMDKSRRGSKATKAERKPSSVTDGPEQARVSGTDISSKRSSKSATKATEVESQRSSRSKASPEGDDMDSSRRGGSSSKKSSTKDSTTNDDDMDSSRRGAPSRKAGKDIVSRRTLRRGMSADDEEEVQKESPKKEKKESRLSALRRASMAAAAAIDDDRDRRSRSSDDDTVSSSRRSASVSRRASVAGDGRIGRETERRGDGDMARTRSRSRRSVSRGRAPEKIQPKEKSMLGDSNDSEQEEEDDVEKLFRKAHEDERKFMLDKSRVGPIRALEPASSDDEDEDDDALMTPRRRKKTGYLPTNLNDTSNVHAPTSAATPRRKEGKKSASRRQSLDDMLFNFAAGPQSNHLSGSASVGYNPTGSGENFSSSASVPGEMLGKKSANPADWSKNVDDLLDARRRSHAADSPRSHKGQLYNSGTTPAVVVSANYASKMRQLQNSRKYSLGGPPKSSSLHQTGSSTKATNLVLPLINTSMDTKKKLNPLGIRRPTMI